MVSGGEGATKRAGRSAFTLGSGVLSGTNQMLTISQINIESSIPNDVIVNDIYINAYPEALIKVLLRAVNNLFSSTLLEGPVLP